MRKTGCHSRRQLTRVSLRLPRKGFGFPFRFKNWILFSLRDKPTSHAWAGRTLRLLLAAVASARPTDSIRCVLLLIVSVRQDAAAEHRSHSGSFLQSAYKDSCSMIDDPAQVFPVTTFPRASIRFVCLVAQLYPTLCDPMNSSPPGSSVHVILQARILEWVANLFSRGSS